MGERGGEVEVVLALDLIVFKLANDTNFYLN